MKAHFCDVSDSGQGRLNVRSVDGDMSMLLDDGGTISVFAWRHLFPPGTQPFLGILGPADEPGEGEKPQKDWAGDAARVRQ
jgi:hypothetical protein